MCHVTALHWGMFSPGLLVHNPFLCWVCMFSPWSHGLPPKNAYTKTCRTRTDRSPALSLTKTWTWALAIGPWAALIWLPIVPGCPWMKGQHGWEKWREQVSSVDSPACVCLPPCVCDILWDKKTVYPFFFLLWLYLIERYPLILGGHDSVTI